MTEYEPVPHPTLRQGDIVLAPSAALVPLASRDPGGPQPGPGRLGTLHRIALWEGSAVTPDVSAEMRFSPVLVLSHDCDLEKDFNERVREFLAAGRSENEALAEAEADPSLDPFAVVAPLLPYPEADPRRHAGIRAGQRIGAFPVDALPGDGGDYFVDLGLLCTIAVQLLPQAGKVASLGRPSVYELRYKLSEAYAVRDLAVLRELESLAGRTIERAVALPKTGKKTSLQLFLEDGGVIHLEIRAPRESLPDEILRTQAR
ncbi:MAG TPA: hypothetical protein VJT67_03000 [Longimicrobiaceae bacterium]|nr:hypothetical protein [Longimicrobiaceae bacterium]